MDAEIGPAAGSTLAAMHVHESGDPGSPAVVFLHGAGASGLMWREHMAALPGFHCLAPTSRASGAATTSRSCRAR